MANDKTPFTQEEMRSIILSAVNSIDFSKCGSAEDLSRQVTRRSITISKMLREGSIEMRALDSVKIFSTVTSVEFEENTQRYLITFKARGDAAEEETVRTFRIDSFDGRVIQPLAEKLKSKVEQEGSATAIIYKFNEPAPPSAKGTRANAHGFRTCCWIELV